jgi:hypothetical protein
MTTNKRTAVKARRRTVKLGVSPEVFEEASRRIAEGEFEFACVALRDLQCWSGASPAHEDYFVALLRPPQANYAWYIAREEAYAYNSPEDCYVRERVRQARVLGLLLCALLAREGFIPPGFEPEKGAEQ